MKPADGGEQGAAMKHVLMLTIRDRRGRDAFQRRCLEAARSFIAAERVRRLVVNLVDLAPADAPYRPTSEIETGDGLPAYDVVLEVVLGDGTRLETLDPLIGSTELAQRHIFLVREHVEKDEQGFVLGERSPGVKYIGRLMFHEDLPDSAAQRSWRIHVPLALRAHAAASKYVRNWVIARLGDGVPETRGISELHFASREDLVERFFDDERGRAEVIHDLKHFVSGGARLYCSEYVLVDHQGAAIR
jgi:hypothetical protein